MSLREAINLINAYPPSISPASITFAIGTPGSVQTINLLSALPAVGSPVTINGFSQGGANYAGTPLIVLDGASITGGNSSLRGLDLEGGNSQVKGLDIGGFAGDAIYLGAGGIGGGDSIVSNDIGTQSLGNEVGIEVAGAINTIGGTAAGAGNVIAFNSLEGILVNRATDNTIHQNSIFSNGPQQLGPGILLEAGGNDNQAAPTISSATTNANLTKLTITGMLNGFYGQATYTLEFFANPGPAAMPDAEGKIYLGSLTIHPTTGSVSFATTISVPATFSAKTPIITATVTASNGDTSAFSAGFDDPPASAQISSASAATFSVGSPGQFLDDHQRPERACTQGERRPSQRRDLQSRHRTSQRHASGRLQRRLHAALHRDQRRRHRHPDVYPHRLETAHAGRGPVNNQAQDNVRKSAIQDRRSVVHCPGSAVTPRAIGIGVPLRREPIAKDGNDQRFVAVPGVSNSLSPGYSP